MSEHLTDCRSWGVSSKKRTVRTPVCLPTVDGPVRTSGDAGWWTCCWARSLQMGPDERAIREVHSTWIDAVNAGDLVCLLSLMADDAVFLNPGQVPGHGEGS